MFDDGFIKCLGDFKEVNYIDEKVVDDFIWGV